MPYQDFTSAIEPVSVSHWSRIMPDRFSDGLGTGPGMSRFCDNSFGFEVLYLARDYETAFVETVIRSKLELSGTRTLPIELVKKNCVVTVSTAISLNLLNLRGPNALKVGIPMAAIKNTNHKSGRALSKHLYNQYPDVDGIIFDSRLTGNPCIGVYDRSKRKLFQTDRVSDLRSLSETIDILDDYNIAIY